MRESARGYFVTGTDTGVGKTEVACGLVRAFAAAGCRAVGMKPVATGARREPGGIRSSDVERLQGAGNVRVARRLINPYCFEPPIAPHLAAERVGRRIDVEALAQVYRELAARADAVIVEGIGGLLVPFNEQHDSADLALRLRLPVILVVGMRLGCLSHALLTAAAIAGRGLTLAGWFANRIEQRMRAYRGNVDALQRRLGAPLLGEIAYRPNAAARRMEVDRALAASQLAASPRTRAARPQGARHPA